MVASASVYSTLALALLAALPAAHATARGLAWATNNDFAPVIGGKPMVTWYHHWEDGPVPQMPSKNQFVPMFWGPSKWDKWNARKSEMNKKLPKYLLGFNEPDISSQANMNPAYAAQVWMQEIHPFGARGVKLGSPAVAWNLDWTAQFLGELKKRGGYVDFVTVHWYGSYKDLAGFKKFVSTARSRFGYKLWITELGVTSSSNPSTQQTKAFMMQAFQWMDGTGYVDRASWFGCFETSRPPDAYATSKNALFKGNARGALTDMGYWYGYTSKPDRRALALPAAPVVPTLPAAPVVAAPAPIAAAPSSAAGSLAARHHALAARLAPRAEAEVEAAGAEAEAEKEKNGTEVAVDVDAVPEAAADDDADADVEVEDCDRICMLRAAALAGYADVVDEA
ncbi:glycosyl hydrolase catalytic core-domain-containing protein [Mycena belliarum]|uniref:Glycosyl hydrolase catalytic core-domain-containing protein n=1 Tax=Mycena belliarum TaxID=1033014 RepID=A0AAD6UCN3_9AGAR|nr:glycosyl hydrolase catalytic core-domain-containing protein [Mycena belliae]